MNRRAFVTCGAVAAVAAGVVVSSATSSTPSPVAAAVAPQVALAVSGTADIGARLATRDGTPDLAVRSYTGQTGLSCLSIARTDGSTFGSAQDGRLTAISVDDSGSCDALAADGVQLLVRITPTDKSSTVLLAGRVGQSVRTAAVDFGQGSPPEALPLARDRSFLVRVPDGATVDWLRVAAVSSDGRRSQWSLAGRVA